MREITQAHQSVVEHRSTERDRVSHVCTAATRREKAKTTENLLGSIIRQLTESHPKQFVPSVRDFYRNRREAHEKPLLDDFVSMLVSMLRCFQRSYIVVDALDECTEETRDSLLTSLDKLIDKLQQLYDFKVMLTMRPGTIDLVSAPPRTGFLEIRGSSLATDFSLHDVTLALLDQGADINDPLPYPDGTGLSALDLACQRGFSQVVQVLLDAGSDPRKALRHGISAIHQASANNHPGILAILLKHDRELVQVRNMYGKTALMDAAERGFADTLDVLLQAGSDPCDKDNNKATPLTLAAASGSRPTVQLLLDAGAPVNSPIPGAKQAIYAAASNADQAMLEFLLEKGADVECRGAVNNNVLHGVVYKADDPSIVGIIMNDAIRNQNVGPVLNARNVHRFTMPSSEID
ncbi:MAG: hypothetical protein Q9207_004057 [Kuettlingeria erythrocarpa]